MNTYIRITAALLCLFVFTAVSQGADLGATTGAAINQPAQPGPKPLAPVRDEVNQDVLWSEDFENGLDDWTTSDLSPIYWHVSNFLARQGEGNHWWLGDTLPYVEADSLWIGYDNNWLQYLDTPVLDLSDGGDDLSLRFDAWWLLEDPRNVPPAEPYDGWDGWFVMISQDGGESFEILTPESPAYTADRLSSAEVWWHLNDYWDLPEEMPGWVFYSTENNWSQPDRNQRPNVEWVQVSFDLSEYTSEETVVRFAMCSDRSVAAAPDNVHNHSYLDRSGIILDNIRIADGDNEYLWNNADDDPVPADLIPNLDVNYSGDFWALTDAKAHGGDFSLWNDDDHWNLINAIDSPPIELPEYETLWFEFWVWCDLPDYESNDPDNTLEDFFQIYLSDNDGATWTYITHDWMRDGGPTDDWLHYIPGISISGNQNLDLTDWAGETVQLRWIFRSDQNNEQGGNGDGLFIDDIEVLGDNRRALDVGMLNLRLPYPNTVGYRTTGLTVEIHNFGIRQASRVPGWWSWWNEEAEFLAPISPNPTLQSDEFALVQINDYGGGGRGWTPSTPGIFEVAAWTALGRSTPEPTDDDENVHNDSVMVSNIRVMPDNLFELGYDNRTHQYSFEIDAGQGAAARFTPADLSIDNYTLCWAWFQFGSQQNEAATFRLHVLGEGDEDTPGEELLNIEVEVPVDSLAPASMSVPLFANEELQRISGEFWLWAEILRDDGWPLIRGEDSIAGAGRFFAYDGQNTNPSNYDLMMHAIVTTDTVQTRNLISSVRQISFEDVLIDQSGTKPLTLFGGGLEPVTITDVRVASNEFEVFFPGEITLNIGESVTFFISFSPRDDEVHADTLIFETDDESPPSVSLLGVGLGVNDGNPALPDKFHLSEARPNPFNSLAQVEFTLPAAASVELKLFDIAGREVAILAKGNYTGGTHSVVLDGSLLPAGIYLMRLESGDRVMSRKVTLLK